MCTCNILYFCPCICISVKFLKIQNNTYTPVYFIIPSTRWIKGIHTRFTVRVYWTIVDIQFSYLKYSYQNYWRMHNFETGNFIELLSRVCNYYISTSMQKFEFHLVRWSCCELVVIVVTVIVIKYIVNLCLNPVNKIKSCVESC